MQLRTNQRASNRQGAIIRARLHEIDMSINELARQLGVATSFVSRVCKGEKRFTTPERIDQAAAILRMNRDDLYLAIDQLPPDVDRAIQRHPEMLTIIRQAAKQLDEKKGKRP